MTRAGFVLVGGRSSRMGRDKAFLPVNGESLATRLARIVGAAAGSVTLIGDPARHAALGYPVIPDLFPGEGPLGGILTALQHTAADLNLIVACDMPGLTGQFLDALLEVSARNPLKLIVPENHDGRLEPLCAVYPRQASGELARAFDRGVRKVTAAFQSLPLETYPVAEVACFQNLNTPEDWARYAAG